MRHSVCGAAVAKMFLLPAGAAACGAAAVKGPALGTVAGGGDPGDAGMFVDRMLLSAVSSSMMLLLPVGGVDGI